MCPSNLLDITFLGVPPSLTSWKPLGTNVYGYKSISHLVVTFPSCVSWLLKFKMTIEDKARPPCSSEATFDTFRCQFVKHNSVGAFANLTTTIIPRCAPSSHDCNKTGYITNASQNNPLSSQDSTTPNTYILLHRCTYNTLNTDARPWTITFTQKPLHFRVAMPHCLPSPPSVTPWLHTFTMLPPHYRHPSPTNSWSFHSFFQDNMASYTSAPSLERFSHHCACCWLSATKTHYHLVLPPLHLCNFSCVFLPSLCCPFTFPTLNL